MASRPESTKGTPVLPKGEYQPARPTDLRGPCPAVNALANHGYIPRDGRNVSSVEIKTAMIELGLSSTIRTALTYAAYLEHHDDPPTGFGAFMRSPFAYLLRQFGLRNPHEQTTSGVAALDLNQLSRHAAIEHDVSLSRRDFHQGDNTTPQKDLITDLISSSADGKVIMATDLANLRVRRLEQQKRDNPALQYGAGQHQMACGESAFILTVFGAGFGHYDVPVSYVEALFAEERLPVREGWRRRRWWTVGFVELTWQAQVLKKLVGKID
ncbi:hypothetical protein MMC34_007495 [Xylographa carneopallida]|nr:hypothetical protein [Xylographa carneopallida]